ncbi:5'-nucleotidase, lipoprotein e(P4) family [Owenweeksia hongkongensis]|uniref:5'-nucleotidase, lipoprotein e(P4) family n=1 Tax=Owenweeksia hongkongensis TaxID=253245 RepID=UPI003A8E9ABF
MRIRYFLQVLVIIGVMSACGNSKQVVAPAAESQVNLMDQHMMSVLWMQHSHEVKIMQEQQYRNAARKLKENLRQASGDNLPAVILDIDETVLDNSPYEARLIRDGEQYSDESWDLWVKERQAALIPGAREFLMEAERLGIEVFYISNRSIEHLEPTIENLMTYNLPAADESHVLLKVEDPDKTERRNTVKDKFEVILYVGDQLSDFVEEQDSFQEDMADNEEMVEHALKYFVILPNPMYGGFEKMLYNNQSGLTDRQIDQKRRDALITKRKK